MRQGKADPDFKQEQESELELPLTRLSSNTGSGPYFLSGHTSTDERLRFQISKIFGWLWSRLARPHVTVKSCLAAAPHFSGSCSRKTIPRPSVDDRLRSVAKQALTLLIPEAFLLKTGRPQESSLPNVYGVVLIIVSSPVQSLPPAPGREHPRRFVVPF